MQHKVNLTALLMLTFIVICSALCCTAGKSSNSAAEINPDLCNCWMHSREEQESNSDDRIFRPCDYKEFPPSRFRQSYTFNSDGSCKYLFLAPTDGHYNKDATFTFDNESKELVIKKKEGGEMRMQLLTLEKDLMLIKSSR